MDDAIKLIQNFGVSAAIIIFAGIAFWRIIMWMKPWVEKIINAHLALVSTLTDSQKQQSEYQKAHAEALNQIAVTQQQQASLLLNIEKTVQGKANGG